VVSEYFKKVIGEQEDEFSRKLDQNNVVWWSAIHTIITSDILLHLLTLLIRSWNTCEDLELIITSWIINKNLNKS